MDQQYSQQLEQQLRQQWDQLLPQILREFTTVSTSDIQSARSADDLVSRIADKSHYSERFVENRVAQLVGVGASGGGTQQQSISRQSQQGQGQQSGQPFGGGQ